VLDIARDKGANCHKTTTSNQRRNRTGAEADGLEMAARGNRKTVLLASDFKWNLGWPNDAVSSQIQPTQIAVAEDWLKR